MYYYLNQNKKKEGKISTTHIFRATKEHYDLNLLNIVCNAYPSPSEVTSAQNPECSSNCVNNNIARRTACTVKGTACVRLLLIQILRYRNWKSAFVVEYPREATPRRPLIMDVKSGKHLFS
ncbi:MAG TPA: hypothetical protein VGO47_10170 [Chlamydiales bacterium]|nr:hypothetical protein [Chlamydiales bacterium]